MLHEIHIQNYAVIERLSLVFHSGLNLLSGETGSGKSILVDALGLALGGRGGGGGVTLRGPQAGQSPTASAVSQTQLERGGVQS